MYTLSHRIGGRSTDSGSSKRRHNPNRRTVVLETFENLEDACVALARKQRSRKNSSDFFIEFRLDLRRPRNNPAQAFSGKGHLKLHETALRQLHREYERLKQGRGVLGQVTGFFAKESR